VEALAGRPAVLSDGDSDDDAHADVEGDLGVAFSGGRVRATPPPLTRARPLGWSVVMLATCLGRGSHSHHLHQLHPPWVHPLVPTPGMAGSTPPMTPTQGGSPCAINQAVASRPATSTVQTCPKSWKVVSLRCFVSFGLPTSHLPVFLGGCVYVRKGSVCVCVWYALYGGNK
jgi:hypothetical protein